MSKQHPDPLQIAALLEVGGMPRAADVMRRLNAEVERLRARAEQAQPVAWGVYDGNPQCDGWVYIADHRDAAYDHIKNAAMDDQLCVTARTWVVRPLYASPPKRGPLTDEEVSKLFAGRVWHSKEVTIRECARAVERAHGIGGENSDD